MLKYNDNTNVNAATIDKTSNTISYSTFQGVNTPNEFNDKLSTLYSLTPAELNHKYTVYLPITLVINADLEMVKNLYLGVLFKQSVPLSKTYSISAPSSVAIVPRYERKWFEFAVPVVVDNNYKNVSFGAYARIGGLFLGSNNLGGILNIAKPRGINIYGGLFIPIFYKKPQTITDCPSNVYKPKKKGYSRRRR